MRYLFICLVVFVLAVEVAFPVGAAPQPEYDKIEALLARIEGNLKQAAGVISVAKAKSAEMVEAKVQEKAELKEAVVQAEAKASVYAARMVYNGLDTAMPAEGEPVVDTVSLNNMMKLNGL
jgi:hypothetical protein